MRLFLFAAMVAALLFSALPVAAETPHRTWIVLRCALCHGVDGAGQTPQGQSTKAPDLRTPAVQKKSGNELAAYILNSHSRTAGMRSQLTTERLKLVVAHIRSLEKLP